MARQSLQSLFEEYGESHRNPVNVGVHWVAVPAIFFSIVALLYAIPGVEVPGLGALRVIHLVVAGILVYYLLRSISLAVGVGLFTGLCVWLAAWLDGHAGWPLWAIASGLFLLAWIAQFIGHGVEGRKPSFLKDLQFLLIGPAWLLAKIYKRMGIPY